MDLLNLRVAARTGRQLRASHSPVVHVACLCVQNALQFIKQCWKMQGRPLFLVLIREDNIK